MPATTSAASAICERDPAGSPDHRTGSAAVASVGRQRRRPIADAADRRDVARPLGVVAELVPQPPDVDVDRPVEDLGLVLAVDRVEQLVAGQHPAVGLEQRGQEPELDGGQRRQPAVDPDLVALAVDDEVAVADRALDVRPGRRRAPTGAIEDPLDAQDELGRRERLRQVVVGARGEAGDPVVDEAARRQDDDRRPVGPADGSQDREPVDLGEHDVEDDERRHLERDRGQRAPAVGRLDDAIARPLEVRPDEADDLGVVVDDEDRPSSRRWPWLPWSHRRTSGNGLDREARVRRRRARAHFATRPQLFGRIGQRKSAASSRTMASLPCAAYAASAS